MSDKVITREDIERLIEDAAYLQDESEALGYVIDSVAYDEKPPEGLSILEKLMLIDSLQQLYFRPGFDQILTGSRPVKISNIDQFISDFEVNDKDDREIQKILSRLSKHRAAILNVFSKYSINDWEKSISVHGLDINSAFGFADLMIKKERVLLKEIADMILALEHEKSFQREINVRQQDRLN
jgi:hypothetical protein